MVRVIIADDQELIRESLKIVLSTHDDIKVVGVAADGIQVLNILEREKADVILMDIRMPGMDGVVCTKNVKAKYPDTKIIILTTFDDDELVQNALRNGAKGYLIKNHTPEHLKQMIKSVYNGTGVMEDAILENLAKNTDMKASGFSEEGYTARELDIIRAVADGLSNKEIANKLFITEGTVKNYITSILAKENLSHRTALAVYYLTGKKQG